MAVNYTKDTLTCGVSNTLFMLSLVKEVVINFPFIYRQFRNLNVLINQVQEKIFDMINEIIQF